MTVCGKCLGSGLARDGEDIAFCVCAAGVAAYEAALDRALWTGAR